ISKKKRLALFNKQLPEALVIIGNCLRSGFTFRHALARVSEDLPNPISEELKRVIREVNYGRKLEESLGELASRTNSAELEMINSAVTIQQRSGGNLAEIVEKVTETINDRINIRNQIRVLTTQGRYSGMLIGLLPVFLLIILTFINPEYMNSFFNTSIGRVMLAISAILEITGFLLIQKIVNIKY
ncbi:type II secretion system F family protein, partial [Bulleidia extructa]